MTKFKFKLRLNKKEKFLASIFGGVLLLLILGISLGYFSLHKQYTELTVQKNNLSKQVDEIENIVTILVSGNEELSAKLQEEKDKRLLAEKDATAYSQKISSLEKNVLSQQATLDSSDITKLIKEWSPRVAKITCDRPKTDGGVSTSKASGVVTLTNSNTQFLTNKHVLEASGQVATKCNISFPNNDIKLTSETLFLVADSDLGYINMNKYVLLPGVVGEVNKCKNKPTIGDQVVILGYPSVGSDNSVTATEGIISGFDDDYYITSAKIERGNSGGAAISVKGNCLLGLPTMVVAGQVESLARILPL